MIDGGLVGLELRCDAEYKSGEAGVSLSLSLSVFFFCVCVHLWKIVWLQRK